MLRLGLTGGLASGKSAVARILAELGAVVFDADAIVHELYRPGGAGARAAKELFGDTVLDRRGEADRARIAEIVFADPGKRLALEARIHPLVRKEIARLFRQAEREGAPVAVAGASQILEAGSESDYDRLLLIVAPEAERLRRWQAGGGSLEDGRRRIGAQISPEAARSRASDIIVNDESLEALRRKTEEVFRRWTSGR
ncbi:MAG: dephospho-CoA kinase [Thermoanaerobaculia bacterium]